ncbi:class I SAM-dependent methyltransferase [Thalassotalea sp. HSM 43]|uniref:class I SAM-dependent methyltransferase n=1 Tax=Thalassotalea sp. HSM 43 TaxID=2552945 RepID=UPI0010802847|nr:class I SAM-dependent methyltransferase [Thalassotalea sp. HSM 43]QBY05897.1 class I SAM-dependent methyltransferase [Thalassotalea sp. HSM 43]
MDKYKTTVATFNKLAERYQDKYMNFEFYMDTYDDFCELVSKANAKIFEIGCGPGNISQYILQKRPDYQLYGIDLAPNMVALAKKNNPGAVFDVMDSRSISQVQGTFDALLCGFCTPYLSAEDVATLIKEARQRLVPGGIFYLSTMEGDDQHSGYQTSSAGDQVFIHYHQENVIVDVLQSNQFEVISVKRKQFTIDKDAANTTDMFIYARAI